MTQRATWAGFAAWAFVGLLAALALLGILSIGIFVAPVAAVVGWLVCRRFGATAVGGALCGVALMPLYVALLNHEGPGNVCHAITNGEECTQEMSPWPWVAVAAVLLLAGLTWFLSLRQRAARSKTRDKLHQ